MFDLTTALNRAIPGKFNYAQPVAQDNYFTFKPAARCAISYGPGIGPDINGNQIVEVDLRADVDGFPIHALENLAAIEYCRQLLKETLRISEEGIGSNDKEKFYTIRVPIEDKATLEKFIAYLEEINLVHFIDETNAARLFGWVIAETTSSWY